MLQIVLVVLLLMNSSNPNEDTDRLTAAGNKLYRKKSFTALVFSNSQDPAASSCHWLNRLKALKKFCLKRKGVAEILLNAKQLSISACNDKFKFDHWQCEKNATFFKKLYRETAFMFSLTSSALTFSIARACGSGTLPGCSCGDHGKPDPSVHWGGCSDNVKHAKKFTRRFLQVKRKGDLIDAVLRYNIEVGIRAVIDEKITKCKCHGISGSCAMKICTKQVSFEAVVDRLKNLYYNAIQIEPSNELQELKKKKANTLLYLEDDILFCPATGGRICQDVENCATLCCGRGFFSTVIQVVVENCECRWCLQVYDACCKSCVKNETVLKCL